MPDKPIGDSQQDFGLTTQYAGSVGTSPIQVPTVAGNDIMLMLVKCPTQTPNTNKLYWSLDNLTYHQVDNGEYVGWPLKGSYKQIYVKGSAAGVQYEVTLNTEPT